MNMLSPNTRILTLLLALSLAAACNRIDTAFVEEMQAGISKANENREAFEAGMKKARDLFERMEKAPEGLKNNPKFGYADLYGRVMQLHDAYASMVTAQSQMVSTVEGILADYTDGKLKKEEAKQEADKNLKNIEGYRERVARMETFVGDASKAYDAMLAQWEVLPEADKIASANMPAPKLPDGRGLRGGATLLSTGPASGAAPASPQSGTSGVLVPPGATPQGTAPSAGTQPGALAPSPQQQQTGTLSPTSPTSPTAPAPKRGQ